MATVDFHDIRTATLENVARSVLDSSAPRPLKSAFLHGVLGACAVAAAIGVYLTITRRVTQVEVVADQRQREYGETPGSIISMALVAVIAGFAACAMGPSIPTTVRAVTWIVAGLGAVLMLAGLRSRRVARRRRESPD